MLTKNQVTFLSFAIILYLAMLLLFLTIKASKEMDNNENLQLSNDYKEKSSEDSFIVGKLNQLLLTIKEITSQPQQNSQTREDSPNIYKGKYLQPFTCINDNCFLLLGIFNGTKEHYRKSEKLLSGK